MGWSMGYDEHWHHDIGIPEPTSEMVQEIQEWENNYSGNSGVDKRILLC